MNERPTRLNMGCGKDIRPGFVNLDRTAFPGVDVVHDLDSYPYPFADDAFKAIVARDILEHLEDPVRALAEIWRIGRPGAEVAIRVPHYSSRYVWADLTHKRGFSLSSLDHFDVRRRPTTSLIEESPVRFEVRFEPLMFAGFRAMGIKWIALRWPVIYESFFCHIFPSGGIQFTLKVVKEARPSPASAAGGGS